MVNKRSTMTVLSPAGVIFCNGFIASSKAVAAGDIKEGKKHNVDHAFSKLTTLGAVLAERNHLDKSASDALIEIGKQLLIIAHNEELAKAGAIEQPPTETGKSKK